MGEHEAGGASLSPKGRQRREAILDAAADILIEEGYAGFATRRIAARLGIRLSNVQYYFASREAVLAALFERSLERAAAQLEQSARDGGLTPLVRFILADQETDSSCRMFWELWALAARDPDAEAVMAVYYRAYRDALAEALAVEVPGLAAVEAQRRAVLIMSLLEGASLFRGEQRGIATDELNLDLMEAVFQLAIGR